MPAGGSIPSAQDVAYQPTWLLILGASTLALTAALALVKALGLTESKVLDGLIVTSTVLTLLAGLLTRELLGATPRQRVFVFLTVVLVLGGSTFIAFWSGRTDAGPREQVLDIPPQRAIADVRARCGTPDLPSMLGTSLLRVDSSVAVQTAAGKSDFIVVVSTDPSHTGLLGEIATISVLTCEKKASWTRTLSLTRDISGCRAGLSTTRLRYPDQEEALFTMQCGSGGFLNFILFGAKDGSGKVSILLERDGLFQGTVGQVGDRLAISAGGLRNEFRWMKQGFAQVTANFSPATTGIIVGFWWEPQGGRADLSEVRADPDERVYFRWDRERNTDDSVASYRMLLSSQSDDAQWAMDERGQNYVVMKRAGVIAEVTAIANGYSGRTISVKVRS